MGLLGVLYTLNGHHFLDHGGVGAPSYTCGVPGDFSELTASILKAQAVILASGATPAQCDLYNYVLMELLENLYHHVEVEEAAGAYPSRLSMWIAEDGSRCNLMTVNPVANADKQGLADWLAYIDGLSEAERAETYRAILLQEAHTKHNGAGAGLLSLRRKAKRMCWQFKPFDAEYQIFTLAVEL